jgi:hypothetical protein
VVKISKQLGVSEIPKAGSIIGHGVDGAGDMGEKGAIAMMALVEGLDAEEPSGGFGGGSGTFALPVDGGGVVRSGVNGAFTKIKGIDQHILVSNGGGKFEVGVGDRASGVCP